MKNKDKGLKQIVGLIANNPNLKGSFIEELFQVILAGEFTELKEKTDPSCEKIIGEMTDLDKALNTLCDKYQARESSIVDFVRGSKKEIPPNEKQKMENELCQIRQRFQVVDALRWSNIFDRFIKFEEPKSVGFGLRAGWKVVLMYVDPSARQRVKVFLSRS